MTPEEKFITIQQVKSLCRVGLMGFISEHKPDPPTLIFISFCEKAIDLVDGTIQLYKTNLAECAQALIRILFETNLKFIHFIALCKEKTPEDATRMVAECLVILREKDALAQDRSIESGNFTERLGGIDIDSVKKKYSQSDIKKIKKYGFPQTSIEDLARKYSKITEYNIMYRNFSRNVHANDTAEYIIKQDILLKDNYNYIEFRNEAAFGLTFRLFLEMMISMNEMLSLNMDQELKRLSEKYSD